MATGFEKHDHGTCIAAALSRAEAECKRRNLQMTPVRRRVLELLLKEHRAVGAYDVLKVLKAEGLGAQPPVAYRALDFLVRNGFAHRVERLNAFVACMNPESTHTPAFFICRSCAAVAETSVEGAMGREAAEVGFVIEASVLEAEGLCPACAGAPA